MREILLIRHAQSANNAQPEHLRVPDPGITSLGQAQVACLRKWMKGYRPDQIFASGFTRALETANGLSEELGLLIHVRADLFEKGGCYSGYPPHVLKGEAGMGREEIAQKYPNTIVEPRISPQGWWHGRSYETTEEAWERSRVVGDWLTAEPMLEGRRSALVIHADFKKLLISTLLNRPEWIDVTEDPHNTSVSILQFSNRWKLVSYNSIGHLDHYCITG